MRILADLHVSPSSVEFLRSCGHEAVRVNDVLPATASDARIIECAVEDDRVVLTQDLDFSALVALGGASRPSVILLRLATSRIEYVNGVLERALPTLEAEVAIGSFITITDHRIRRRRMPIE